MVVAIVAALVCAVPAAALTVTEYPAPPAGVPPAQLAAGADGGLWYIDALDGTQLRRFDPSTQAVTTRTLPALVSTLAPAPDGRLWITLIQKNVNGSNLHVYDPGSGALRLVPVPATRTVVGVENVIHVAHANDAGVWVTGSRADNVVRIDPSTLAQQVFAIKHPAGQLAFPTQEGLAPDAGTGVWLGLLGGTSTEPLVGRVTAAGGQGQFYKLPFRQTFGFGPPSTTTTPCGFGDFGPEAFGSFWVTMQARCADDVARLDPATGQWTTIRLGTAANTTLEDPFELIAGPDAAMWASVDGGVTRIDPASGAHQLHVFPTFDVASGAPSSSFRGAITLAGGDLWIAGLGTIARVDPDGTGPDTGNARSVLQNGLATDVDCSASCSGSVRVDLAPTGTVRAAAVRGRRLASVPVRLRRGGGIVRVRFGRRARQQITRAGRRARVTVSIGVRDGGKTRRSQRVVILRRR